MLEKISRNFRINELCAKLLLEADSNTLYDVIFNSRLMPLLDTSMSIPQEIIDRRSSQAAMCLVLNK